MKPIGEKIVQAAARSLAIFQEPGLLQGIDEKESIREGIPSHGRSMLKYYRLDDDKVTMVSRNLYILMARTDIRQSNNMQMIRERSGLCFSFPARPKQYSELEMLRAHCCI